MSRWLIGLSAVVMAVAPATAADDAKAVIEKAIKAHGGAELLNKFKAGTSSGKGQLIIFDMEIPFTGEIVYELPNKFKMTLNADFMGQKLDIVQVVDGDKVKNVLNNMEIPLGDKERQELIQAAAMQEITQLTPLLDAKKFTVKLEKDEKVEGRPASVLVVSGKNFENVRLFFDKESGLLVKTSRKGLAPGAAGESTEVTEDTIMSDYKDIQGVKTAMKIVVTHDGKKFMTMEVTEAKLMERADAKMFSTDD